MKVEISYDGLGWSIDLVGHPTDQKRAWGSNGTIAHAKARIIADYYRDENGQSADIVWVDVLDKEGKVVRNGG
jgi:hypothetical protein